MGCCVSKCKPKRQFMEEMSNNVQDKLVISQTPKTPLSVSNRICPLPLLSSSTSNSSSFASYFSTSSSATTCSSKPGSSSPSLTSKERSFSNEFLLACVKENPHIIRMNPIKEKPGMNKAQSQRPKRVRSGSPTPPVLARQKSFRREAEMGNSAAALPCRAVMRSPSPSRRLSNREDKSLRGILASVERESDESKRVVGTKLNALNSVYATALGRESSRRVSESVGLRNRETRVHRVSSKIDQVAVGAALSQSQHQISESVPPEDFDNPLISLDCFIFL